MRIKNFSVILQRNKTKFITMATPAEKLAQSLSVLRQFQQNKASFVVRSADISRTHLERLVANGFLAKVINGWYIVSNPSSRTGDTTDWYISYWDFIAAYTRDKLGEDWSLTAESSLDVLTGNWRVSPQVIVRSPKCQNTIVNLLFGCSIFFLKADCASKPVKESRYGLNVYGIPEALVMASPAFFQNDKITARAALATIRNASEVLPFLLDNGRSVRAGRLIGAFNNVKMPMIADDIKATMERLDYVIREEDPFAESVDFVRDVSPYATRIRLMWQNMRANVLAAKPNVTVSMDVESYLFDVDERYKQDAYHSLSIEGYKVSEELIEKVRLGLWNPEKNETDKDDRNALAARGYWQSFQEVRKSIRSILEGKNAGEIVEKDHRNWYREMFAPCVMAGIIKPTDLAGYRSGQVYIKNSMHTPLNPEVVRDAMPVLFDLLKTETDAWVRAVLGHFLFTFIHPYMDGNGRMGRFLMNTMLASGGYRWTIVPQNIRNEYMTSLEKASVNEDIKDFAALMSKLVNERN